jgi:hypothetical protein
LTIGTSKALATTWNEPWAEKVIKEADYFVLADITSYDKEKGVKINIVKQFGGDELPSKIQVTGFYLLDLTSVSGGHRPEFNFKNIDKSYFFIKRNDKGEYCIATPTTGFDNLKRGNVGATYRHSYHQALIPAEIYEMTMTAIFNNYHQLPYDKKAILDFIDLQLSQKPAGFDENEIKTFFTQHAALESIYHLKLEGQFNKIIPFLNDTLNFHNRVSAARALAAYNSTETKQILMDKIASDKENGFVAVICIWTLQGFNAIELKPQLQKLAENASTEGIGFGGNIMDPRVGTDFPTVKSALEDLIRHCKYRRRTLGYPGTQPPGTPALRSSQPKKISKNNCATK